MTAQEILAGLRESSRIPWAYHFFEVTPSFPFGVILDDNRKTLYCDNKPYFSMLTARLELYDAIPNEQAETAVEGWLNSNASNAVVMWRKDPRENVAPDDETAPFFMTAYYFEVIDNA